MANDKNTPTIKPFLPRLASTKSPITPRLATQHLRASPIPSLASVASPRSDANKSNVVKSPVLSREDCNTPVRALLNSNITPRSSHRKSRIQETGSNVTTPSEVSVDQSLLDVGGARSAVRANGHNANTHTRAQSVLVEYQEPITSLPAKMTAFVQDDRSGNRSPSDGGLTSDSKAMFFHASDVKAMEAPPIRPQPKKAATFVYANGESERRSNGSLCRSPSPTLSTMSMKSHQGPFQHANVRPSPTVTPRTAQLTRNKSPDARPTFHRGQSSTSSTSTHFSLRPPSPQKTNFHLTFRKGASQILPNRAPAPPVQAPVRTPSSPRSKRRSTIESQSGETSPAHVRAGSLSSIDTSTSSRKSSLNAGDLPLRQSIHARSSPIVASTSQGISTSEKSRHGAMDSSHDMRPATASSGVAQITKDPLSPKLSQSPGPKSSISVPTNFAEAAANARRERKVLDLEISNSSLLAINRQLEREVRRQKMEIRRFRRLSRAGRLSGTGSMASPYEDIDGSGSEDGEVGNNVRDLDDEEASDEDNDSQNLSSLSEESLDLSAMSPSGLTERGAARLEKDEKRLKLDLDRHRQLLIDSQKMNQSLKRCMTWTEEMIAEGRKALAYKVNVSDVQLGGRVLQEDDMNDASILEMDETNDAAEEHDHNHEVERRQGLLGSWSPLSASSPLVPLTGAADSPLGLAVSLGENEQPMKHQPVLPYSNASEQTYSIDHISDHETSDGYFPPNLPP